MNRKSDNQAFKELEILETPMNCIVVGMAGSGKTTLLQRIKAHCNEKSIKAYMINLDPAVYRVPYATDIDIRDSVNYQKVMQNFDLGPNGAILTSLNLFATKFDQVLRLISKRAQSHQYAFIDTPGQVEAFTWSASGAVISESLSTSFPTAILFVVDSTRTKSPVTFMSNMMYACSILYKTNLPLLFCAGNNKTESFSTKSISIRMKWRSNG
ncbi:GPN-loop GTPase 1, variant 2 [Bonamia ostreae]|uniref:GPN-loop GTPase n=1 Tax=Bonamia ostreae TaxID=126728 RepID=A0ABV2AJA5_9EUKA